MSDDYVETFVGGAVGFLLLTLLVLGGSFGLGVLLALVVLGFKATIDLFGGVLLGIAIVSMGL